MAIKTSYEFGLAYDNEVMTDLETMKAVQQESLGSTDVLHLVDVPKPRPGIGEVLIAVHASGLNATDWANRARVTTVDRLPLVLGWDVAGVVESVGVGVSLFAPGDEVFGMLPYPNGVGAHAQYVVGPARAFAPKPAGIDHVHAAALPLAAMTAYQSLIDTAGIESGQRVLIHGASGGVGHLAVQIAKSQGAFVIATASASKHEFVKSLGADEVIDYHSADLLLGLRDVDVVLDPVSLDRESRGRSARMLRRGGTLVSLLPQPLEDGEAAEFAQRGIRFAAVIVEADSSSIRAVAALAKGGQLRPHVDAVFPLSETAAAHRLGESGSAKGKIVISVAETRKHAISANVLRSVFEPGGDTSQVDTHVRPDYIQHNPLAPDGPEAMKAFGAAWKQQFPEATYTEEHGLTDGDFALLHSHGVTVPGTPGLAVFDIFRFQDGKIAEHWDILQEIPEALADDAFDALSEPEAREVGQRLYTRQNAEVVRDFVDQVLVQKNLDTIDAFASPQYREHSLHVPQTGRGLRADLAGYFETNPELSVVPKRVIAEGGLVAVHSHYTLSPEDRGLSVVDLFRVRDLRIVEHWSAAQAVPEVAANDNTMF